MADGVLIPVLVLPHNQRDVPGVPMTGLGSSGRRARTERTEGGVVSMKARTGAAD